MLFCKIGGNEEAYEVQEKPFFFFFPKISSVKIFMGGGV